MKSMFLVFIILLYATPTFAQKPVIDSTAVLDWPIMYTDAVINNDGSYFLYTIGNKPRESQTLVIQKTDNTWQREFPDVRSASFVADQQVLFQQNDTLFLFSLVSKILKTLPDISDYKQPDNGNGTWLAYRKKKPENNLVLLNLLTSKQQQIPDVLDYAFDKKGTILLIKTIHNNSSQPSEALQWIDLKKEYRNNIWAALPGQSIGDYSLDAAGEQLAFMVNEKNATSSSLWYYSPTSPKALLMAANGSSGITPELSVSSAAPWFSQDGQYIFFSLQAASIDSTKPRPHAVKVDIWSYKDSVLQSTQLLTANNPPPEYTAVIGIVGRKIMRLCLKDETIVCSNGEFVVISNKASIIELWWKTYSQKSFFLVALKDGMRHRLNNCAKNAGQASLNFSPGGKYLIYFDPDNNTYYSYNLISGQVINISKKIQFSLTVSNDSEIEDRDSLHKPKFPIDIAGWLLDDAALLVYDSYDIWRIDPADNQAPVNITNGYGRLHHIKLRIVDQTRKNLFTDQSVFSADQPLLLSAFNTLTKYNGFYQKDIHKTGNPVLLSIGPYYIYTTSNQIPFGSRFNYLPLKAKKKEVWIVTRQTASDAPNYFITNNFKTYKRLTDLQPQKKYNWLTTELLNFKQLDNTISQGTLYKPENFDPAKKYPVIFSYYEKLSQYCYQYQRPEFSGGAIDIPWFVSRGYLVFTPDIHYTFSKTGESVCNSVVAAAQKLAQMPWVDSTKMGISGHSFGGYETNYLVTHSNVFAAAITAAGVSDEISAYGGLYDNSWGAGSQQENYETGQHRLGYTLWERPDVYIQNSSVFNLHKVTTPLLIVHNKGDYLVPFSQSVELFTGLRRLQKKAWMLQYDEGGHGVWKKEAEDLTIRMTQFFDHYLKSQPAPLWMTEGIPAKYKGIQNGYKLDTSGKVP